MPNYSTMDARDGNYMVINGMRYPVINSWVESGRGGADGRLRWGIVTEGETEEQPPAADATPPLPISECEGGSVCQGHPERPVVTRDSGGIPPGGGLLVEPLPYSPPREPGLYDDKCAECTTGISCSDAARCLFEG
jgi:hypothetical protein